MLKGKRILVVEDEAMIAMMLEDEFRSAGAEVETAATINEALLLLNAGSIDAAVLDCNLQGVPVTQVADTAYALAVPFLFATGYGEDYNKGVHTGVITIEKPYNAERVILIVSGFFEPDGSAG